MYAYLKYRAVTQPNFIAHIENNRIVSLYDIRRKHLIGDFENRDITELVKSFQFKVIHIEGKVI